MDSARYESPNTRLQFGDIYPAQTLFDAHLRLDAVQMGTSQPPKRFGEGAVAFSAAFLPHHDFVLAHGTPCLGILVSDDCAIDDAFGVDRQRADPRGRLLFAAVTEATQLEIQALEDLPAFDRFPLPADARFAGGIAELRRVFMLDARAVKTDPGDRVVSLSDDLAAQLSVTWSAFALRRGPLAAAKCGDALAKLLDKVHGASDASHASAALSVAQVVATCWTFEGEQLDRLIQTVEEGLDPLPSLQAVLDGLESLRIDVESAREALAKLVPD